MQPLFALCPDKRAAKKIGTKKSLHLQGLIEKKVMAHDSEGHLQPYL